MDKVYIRESFRCDTCGRGFTRYRPKGETWDTNRCYCQGSPAVMHCTSEEETTQLPHSSGSNSVVEK